MLGWERSAEHERFPGHTYYENTLWVLDSDFLTRGPYFPTSLSSVIRPSFLPFLSLLLLEENGDERKGGGGWVDSHHAKNWALMGERHM